jgi:plastocyanin
VAVASGVLAAAFAGAFATNAGAAPHGPPTAADYAKLQDELAKVQQELRDQRQLILQLMQMHDALLKYVQLGGAAPAGARPAAAPPTPALPTADLAGAPAGATKEAPPVESAPAPGARASITGKVRGGAGALGEAYVYLDGPKSIASRAPTLEVKQVGRQFVPNVAVVQVGGRVVFPNEDKVFHNVFSRTPGDSFDLGTLKAGDTPNPVVLLKPGHVEVFCNIHSKMRADILVVPNGHWTRVRSDGSFTLPAVPVGTHNVVLWGPSIKPVTQRVEVTAAGGTASFSADAVTRGPHLNKQGGAYESYEN